MGLMLALGSFSFWQDQLSQLWGDAELPQLLPRIFTALFPGLLSLFRVFQSKQTSVDSKLPEFFFSTRASWKSHLRAQSYLNFPKPVLLLR